MTERLRLVDRMATGRGGPPLRRAVVDDDDDGLVAPDMPEAPAAAASSGRGVGVMGANAIITCSDGVDLLVAGVDYYGGLIHGGGGCAGDRLVLNASLT